MIQTATAKQTTDLSYLLQPRPLTDEEATLLRNLQTGRTRATFTPQELEAAPSEDDVEDFITELCKRNPYM